MDGETFTIRVRRGGTGFFRIESEVESDVDRLKAQLGWDDYAFDVVKWRSEVHKRSPGWLRAAGDSLAWALADGDASKIPAVKKMEITEALKILVMKQADAFKVWYQMNGEK